MGVAMGMTDAREDFEATTRAAIEGYINRLMPAPPNMPIWACTGCRAGWPRGEGADIPPPMNHLCDLRGPAVCGGSWRESFLGDLPLVEYVP
jgi:hypothetical protein